MGKLVVSLLFLISISSNSFAEEKTFTNKDLEKYQPKSQEKVAPLQEVSDSCEHIVSPQHYTECVWKKIDKTCGYVTSQEKTKEELRRSLEACNSILREVNGNRNIPSDTKVLMMNEITIGIEQINKSLYR